MDNLAIINLKTKKMIFEGKHLRVITPLDPKDGDRYSEPIQEESQAQDLDRLYQPTANKEDYINPTADGTFSW